MGIFVEKLNIRRIMLYNILALFAIYFLFSILFFEDLRADEKKRMLFVICAITSIIIGIRDPYGFSDTAGYTQDYLENTKSLTNLSVWDGPRGYSEMGFYYLGVILKTLNESITFYYVSLSLITFLILYIGIKKFSILPFIGLYVYLGRFVGRNTVQIRAALAIAIVIWGTVYITKNQLWKYLFVILIASRFHESAFVAFPLVLMNYVKIKKEYIYWGILLSLLIAVSLGGLVHNIVSQSQFANEMARSYVEDGSEKAYSNSLLNPIIWYQIIILFLFTYYENRLSKMTEHYYMIRNAYFYSTVILIILYQFAILAARCSTIFATFEIAIIPYLLTQYKGWMRNLGYMIIGILYFVFFYINIRTDF